MKKYMFFIFFTSVLMISCAQIGKKANGITEFSHKAFYTKSSGNIYILYDLSNSKPINDSVKLIGILEYLLPEFDRFEQVIDSINLTPLYFFIPQTDTSDFSASGVIHEGKRTGGWTFYNKDSSTRISVQYKDGAVDGKLLLQKFDVSNDYGVQPEDLQFELIANCYNNLLDGKMTVNDIVDNKEYSFIIKQNKITNYI